MNKACLYFTVLALLASCNLDGQDSGADSSRGTDEGEGAAAIKGIRFVVESARRPTHNDSVKASVALHRKDTIDISELLYDKRSIKVCASLYNDNVDTVYFLTTTCDGVVNSLRYDVDKFILSPYMNCNAVWPQLLKIAPKDKYPFEARLVCITKEKKSS